MINVPWHLKMIAKRIKDPFFTSIHYLKQLLCIQASAGCYDTNLKLDFTIIYISQRWGELIY